MKLILALAALVFLLGCNSGSDQSAKVDTPTIITPDTTTVFSAIDSSTEFLDTFSTNLQPWLEQTIKSQQVRLRDFSYADNWVDDSFVIIPQNLDRDFLKTYESVLSLFSR